MKKILIFSEDFPPNVGGIAQWAAGMAESFQKLGYDVAVLTRFLSQEIADLQRRSSYPVRHMRGNYWKKLRTWYAYKGVKSLVKSGFLPDTVIATTWNLARGATGLAKKFGFRLIIVVHGLEVTRKMTPIKQKWLKETLNAADLIVSVSHFTKERVVSQHGIAPEKIMVLPNGVNPEQFFPISALSDWRRKYQLDGQKVILTLARLKERKGHDRVIQALPKILSEVPNVRYLISGKTDSDYARRLMQLCRDLNLEKQVTFIGYIEPEALNAHYNLCDVYIMPSYELTETGDTEGFGITYLEANACEKPVIGGRSGGVLDAIEDGKSGFLVAPDNILEIEEKLLLLLKNPEVAEKIGKYGRERILKSLTWERIAERLAETTPVG
ncbi:glycosyl transferase group 1 [Chloroherpeton thalassium ATCC 35110]|uniref:Glycosyl transferase group 1 n=1 Tax=Chloroherpeton thalassium (strain ATCC 35110 / GB-78) TaxID=517418 RepID=B3QTM1_CHLT3|nr:glycosyltransferase family 4 protein [Chloroherpeton thalassium]ACF12767.1 glycosyl transferase group 1 [Chloroherpeton thalassium ATCC 35110]